MIGGVEPTDLTDPHAALAAIEAAGFVISLEMRESAVTALADVVFPVAPVAEKGGSFTDWQGRGRPFDAALPSNAASDLRVLQTLADELGVDLGFRDTARAAEELSRLSHWDGDRGASPSAGPTPASASGPGEAVFCRLADVVGRPSRLQDGEPHLAEPPDRRWHGSRRQPRPASAPPTASP